MDSKTQQELKSYLEGLIPEATLEAAADDTEAPMRMSNTMAVPKTEAERAQAAVQKLARGHDLTDDDQFLIEAIIIPDKRPAIDIVDGRFSVQHPIWVKYNVDKTIEDNIERAIKGVARIDVPTNDRIPYAGTGFLVGGNLMMTNRHVAGLFASGIGDATLAFRPGERAAADFEREKGSAMSNPIRVTRVQMIHPYWDMAILELEELPAGAEPLTLSLTDPDALTNRDVAVIGFPAFDPRNDAAVQHKVFGGTYNVKRLQPGLLKGRAPKLSYGNTVNTVTHDASTLGGNSGSCVLDVSTGEVVGLHFAGRYRDKNFAVPAFELSRDARVDALALEFGEDASSNVDDPNPWQSYWDGTETRAPISVATGTAGAGGQSAQVSVSDGGGHSVSLTIPVTVTVTIGDPAQPTTLQVPAVVGSAPADDVEKMVEPARDHDYANRLGYDEGFLGVPVPMPKATNLDDLSKLDDGSHTLHYVHFSLMMNKRRRLAQISGANVDANPARTKPEPGRDYTRRGLNGFTSKNDRERWFTDPRIPGQHQLPDRFFTKDRTAFDKGHIVRRNDVVWGDSYSEVQNANGDTFHVTNCSPQVKGFNRSNTGGLWGKLENIVLKEAATEKLCVFAGPIFAEDDPIFSGVDDLGAVQVRIPREYWKVIVAEKAGALQTFGFILEQDLTDVDFEFQLSQTWERRLIPMAELQERICTINFADAIMAGDQG